jgi:hypothetical protein
MSIVCNPAQKWAGFFFNFTTQTLKHTKMKKFTIITLILIAFYQSQSQKLVEDGVDEFTGNYVKRTSWKTICENMSIVVYFRVTKINKDIFFNLKVMKNNKVFSIDKDALLMFKLENKEVVELPNLEYAMTCIGCGAISISGSQTEGIETSYLLNHEQFNKLKNNVAIKFRIYSSLGYMEDDLKLNNYEKIKKSLTLIQ